MKKIIIIISLYIISSNLFAQNSNQLLSIKSNLKINSNTQKVDLLNNNFEKKSPGMAILYSVLLPGMGHLYADDFSTGKYFTITDGVLWGVFSGISVYGNMKENDYKDFAQAYGNVNLNGKDDAFFANIGIYENVEQFNTEQELNRDFDAVYNTESHYWAWNTETQRKDYRNLWTSSENAKNNVRFAVGALILNRIVSAIFAVRSVNAYNKRQSNDLGWNLNFGSNFNSNSMANFKVNFQKSF